MQAHANSHRRQYTRATFIGMAGAAAAGIHAWPWQDHAAYPVHAAGGCTDTLADLLNTALIAERLAGTFYYTALTSQDLMADTQLGGSSTDPNHPGLPPNGNPGNVRFLQAALDAESKHAAALEASGARSPFRHFYFPEHTFEPACTLGNLCTLGTSSNPKTFLGVLQVLETAFVGAYLAAIGAFVRLGYPRSAQLSANIMAVESEHLVIGRVIADANPSNDLTLAAAPFGCIHDAAVALQPFLTGQGFGVKATRAIALPHSAQVGRVVGRSSTRIVTRFT